MDVITMDVTNLLEKAKTLFPDIHFEMSSGFRWSPETNTVYSGDLTSEQSYATLFHEIGHALAHHQEYNKDIELLVLEREAWTKARDEVAPLFHITIAEEIIEDALDTYREWLHARSTCPECSQNGVQHSPGRYMCLLCHTSWRVNDARQCGLKRYRLKLQKTPAM